MQLLINQLPMTYTSLNLWYRKRGASRSKLTQGAVLKRNGMLLL